MANYNTPWNKGQKQCSRDLAILDNPDLLASAQRYKSGVK
jgi:hypothetical protein